MICIKEIKNSIYHVLYTYQFIKLEYISISFLSAIIIIIRYFQYIKHVYEHVYDIYLSYIFKHLYVIYKNIFNLEKKNYISKKSI